MDSLIKPFTPKKASFGRHETFALRYSWLTKGFQAFNSKNTIFSSEESTIELGVGKNRVNAIKYWLRATAMLDDSVEGLDASLKLIITTESAYLYRSFADRCDWLHSQ